MRQRYGPRPCGLLRSAKIRRHPRRLLTSNGPAWPVDLQFRGLLIRLLLQRGQLNRRPLPQRRSRPRERPPRHLPPETKSGRIDGGRRRGGVSSISLTLSPIAWSEPPRSAAASPTPPHGTWRDERVRLPVCRVPRERRRATFAARRRIRPPVSVAPRASPIPGWKNSVDRRSPGRIP
jgi:hypothetical protein